MGLTNRIRGDGFVSNVLTVAELCQKPLQDVARCRTGRWPGQDANLPAGTLYLNEFRDDLFVDLVPGRGLPCDKRLSQTIRIVESEDLRMRPSPRRCIKVESAT